MPRSRAPISTPTTGCSGGVSSENRTDLRAAKLLHPDAQMPLQAATQPTLRNLVEVQGTGPAWLVLAAGNPRIELQIPDLALPPIAGGPAITGPSL